MENTFPTYEQMNNWPDNQLKLVHKLIFDDNVDPGMGEPREWVDDYMYELHLVFERRFS